MSNKRFLKGSIKVPSGAQKSCEKFLNNRLVFELEMLDHILDFYSTHNLPRQEIQRFVNDVASISDLLFHSIIRELTLIF